MQTLWKFSEENIIKMWKFSGNQQITGGSPALWPSFQERWIQPWGPGGQMTLDVACLQANMVPNNTIWSASAPWLLGFSVSKIQGALVTPMDMPIMPPRPNDHDVAHLCIG